MSMDHLLAEVDYIADIQRKWKTVRLISHKNLSTSLLENGFLTIASVIFTSEKSDI